MKRDSWLGYALIAPAVVVVALFIFFPIFEAFRLSLYNRVLTIKDFHFVGFETYLKLFRNGIFQTAFKNTGVWILCASLIGMLFGGIVGIILAQEERRLTRVAGLLILIPFVMPDVVVAAIWKWLYNTNIGVINALIDKVWLREHPIDWLGTAQLAFPSVILVMAWRIAPLGALLINSSYKSISLELLEASEIDGAGLLKRLRYIVLPLLKYPIIIGFLLTMMWVMQNLSIVRLITDGGPGRSSEILSTYIYKLNFLYYRESEASAGSVIYFIFLLAVSIIYLTVFRRVWSKEE